MEDPRFIPDVLKTPKTQYTPAAILGKYYEYRTNRKAAFQPGTDFNYSDVNYVLLALIIEKIDQWARILWPWRRVRLRCVLLP